MAFCTSTNEKQKHKRTNAKRALRVIVSGIASQVQGGWQDPCVSIHFGGAGGGLAGEHVGGSHPRGPPSALLGSMLSRLRTRYLFPVHESATGHGDLKGSDRRAPMSIQDTPESRARCR